MKKLVIIGAGGHGRVIADIARLNGYEDIIFLDDDTSVTDCGRYKVKGTAKDAVDFAKSGYDISVAVGNSKIRERLIEDLMSTGKVVSLIHPSAVIGEEVSVLTGTVIMAGTVINPGASIGKGCIINTGASVDHDNTVGDYSHISVGAHLAGTVTVGRHVWVGIGASVSNNIEICDEVTLGAGAVVIKDIIESGTYVGVPAGRI